MHGWSAGESNHFAGPHGWMSPVGSWALGLTLISGVGQLRTLDALVRRRYWR